MCCFFYPFELKEKQEKICKQKKLRKNRRFKVPGMGFGYAESLMRLRQNEKAQPALPNKKGFTM